MPSDPLILHVEDDPNDVLLFNLALRKKEAGLPICSVPNGQEALKYLQGANSYSDRARFPVPHLIVLDLKLPGLNGFEVLEWVRSQGAFKDVPVFVLSSSFHAEDLARAEALGADKYFVKHYDFADVVEAIVRSRLVRGCSAGEQSIT